MTVSDSEEDYKSDTPYEEDSGSDFESEAPVKKKVYVRIK